MMMPIEEPQDFIHNLRAKIAKQIVLYLQDQKPFPPNARAESFAIMSISHAKKAGAYRNSIGKRGRMSKSSTKKIGVYSDQQKQATDPASSVWVHASAGTGKTHVLVGRVLRLLLERDGIDPQSILCITYTRAAAEEMRQRLYERLRDWAVMSKEDLAEEIEALEGVRAGGSRKSRERSIFSRAFLKWRRVFASTRFTAFAPIFCIAFLWRRVFRLLLKLWMRWARARFCGKWGAAF